MILVLNWESVKEKVATGRMSTVVRMLIFSVPLAVLQLRGVDTEAGMWTLLLGRKPHTPGFCCLSNGDGDAGGNDGSEAEGHGDGDEEVMVPPCLLQGVMIYERGLCPLSFHPFTHLLSPYRYWNHGELHGYSH